MKRFLFFFPLIIIVSSLASATIDWTTSLPGYWGMENGVGLNASDFSANNRNFSLFGGVGWVPGKVGSFATQYNGLATYLYNDQINSDPFQEITWSIWFKTNGTAKNDQALIFVNEDASNGVRYLTLQRDRLLMSVGDGVSSEASLYSSARFGNNTWYHIGVTITNSSKMIRLYVNGLLDNSTSFATLGDPSTTMRLGSHTSGIWFLNGTLDEFGYWNRTLSATELNEIYNMGNGIYFGNQTNNGTLTEVYETDSIVRSDIFNTSNSGVSVSSATLNLNNASYYSASVDGLGSNIYNLSTTFDVPAQNSPIVTLPYFFSYTLSNGSTGITQTKFLQISQINLTLCGAAPNNIRFLNYTFRNETTASERVPASLTASIIYWLGSGTSNKTLSYSTASENLEYDFCFNPANRNLNIIPNINYANSYSLQRNYEPGLLSILNTTNNYTLYLLPTSLGIYVSFKIINQATQSISGAVVNLTRSGFGLLEARTTSSAGLATFFLNPLVEYTVCAARSDLGQFCTVDQFTETQYTIILGGSTSSTTPSDYTKGVSYSLLPVQPALNANQDYNFTMVFNSSYWTATEFGFTLSNSTGSIFGSSSSGSTVGSVIVPLNTGLNRSFIMNAYWIINGTYTNVTKTYTIVNLGNGNYSINNFFSRLLFYLNDPSDTDGIFGLKNDGTNNFSLGLIVFAIIFLSAGLFSFKYGVTSPGAIMLFIFSFTFLFDVGLGLVPRPVETIPFATVMVGIVTLIVFIREWSR